MADLTGTTAVGNTRDVLFASGDSGAALSVNRDLSELVAGSVPGATAVPEQIMHILRQSQQGYNNTANAATQQQALRMAAPATGNSVYASPSQQSAARNASVGALEPTIGGARAAIAELAALQTQYEQTISKNKADKKQAIDLLLATGSAAEVATYLAENPEAFKDAGYDPKTIPAIVSRLKVIEDRETAMFNKSMQSGGGAPALTEAQKSAETRWVSQSEDLNAIQGILAPHGFNLATLTESQINALGKQEIEAIGTHLFFISNPESKRNPTGEAIPNMFDPSGVKQLQAWGQGIFGRPYLSSEVFEAIDVGKRQAGSTYEMYAGAPLWGGGQAGGGNTVRVRRISTGETGSMPANEVTADFEIIN